jgi:hypothetical protein
LRKPSVVKSFEWALSPERTSMLVHAPTDVTLKAALSARGYDRVGRQYESF